MIRAVKLCVSDKGFNAVYADLVVDPFDNVDV
jgi:hypothetical protein